MKLIAHRGAVKFYPENTLEAFTKAVALGFDGIECDVRRCQSGQLIVFHDSNLKRLTGIDAKVRELSWQQIQNQPIEGQYQIPLLEDVIRQIVPHIWVNFELKQPQLLADITKMIPAEHAGRVLISAKSPRALTDSNSALARAVVHPIALIAWLRARRIGLKTISTRAWLINRPFWRLARRSGFDVIVYPLNQPRRLTMLRKWGATGAITDLSPQDMLN